MNNLLLDINKNMCNIDEMNYLNYDSSILHIGKMVDTLVIENLDTRQQLMDISLLGFVQIPTNLIINSCNITPNFTIFDTEYLFDFLSDGINLRLDLIRMSGEVSGGEINLPALLGVDETGKMKIRHLDVADLKFKQTLNIDTIENDPAMDFFASDIGKITLPDTKGSHLLAQIIKQKFNSTAVIEYR